MKTSGSLGAVVLCLLAVAAAPAGARQAQVQSPQQAQQAQQARQEAESFLRGEEAGAAGTGGKSGTTGTSGVGTSGVGKTGTGGPAGPSYGPVLNPRQPQSADPARKDPAEVHDEADSLSRQPQTQPQQQPQRRTQKQSQRKDGRRQAWQGGLPMAPRPLDGGPAPVIGQGMVPVPAPAQPPQAVVPGSAPLGSCVGGACRDAAGASYNLGPSGSGVNGAGRPCTRSGATVQCL